MHETIITSDDFMIEKVHYIPANHSHPLIEVCRFMVVRQSEHDSVDKIFLCSVLTLTFLVYEDGEQGAFQ